MLVFEEVIKNSTTATYREKALIQMAKTKIRSKDFYDAHYIMKRAHQLSIASKRVSLYSNFLEGVLM